MTDVPSKLNANMNATIGTVKENVGSTIGNNTLESKGIAQKAEGNAEYKAAEVKEAKEEPSKIHANINYAVGVAKENVGYVLGNKSLEASGLAQKAEGNAEYKAAEANNLEDGPSKTSANINYAVGAIKENAGYIIGNHSLEANGAAQKAKGDSEFKAAENLEFADGVKDNIKGNIKDTVGSAIGNEQMAAEGKDLKLKGDFKKEINS